MSIKVCDAPMGSGKTSAAIRMMNQNPDRKYLFVTPYLKEAERITACCPLLHFKEPVSYDVRTKQKTKAQNIKRLLRDGSNVVTTHALFSLFDDETIALVEKYQYTLILDEVLQVIEKITIDPDDVSILTEMGIIKSDVGCLRWVGGDYKDYGDTTQAGKYMDIRKMMQSGRLWEYKGNTYIHFADAFAFQKFRDVYILTYMFEAQDHCALFKLQNVDYQYIGVDGAKGEYFFTDDPTCGNKVLKGCKDKIHFVDDNRNNDVGNNKYSLSVASYRRGSDLLCDTIRRRSQYMRIRGFNSGKTISSKEIMWTCFKIPAQKIRGFGLSSGEKQGNFVPCNARAENRWSDRHYLIYLVNRFPDTMSKNFFQMHNIELNDDDFALSEMVQWIWRSAIRNGEDIWIYIPSSRMRRLLETWLEKVS